MLHKIYTYGLMSLLIPSAAMTASVEALNPQTMENPFLVGVGKMRVEMFDLSNKNICDDSIGASLPHPRPPLLSKVCEQIAAAAPNGVPVRVDLSDNMISSQGGILIPRLLGGLYLLSLDYLVTALWPK